MSEEVSDYVTPRLVCYPIIHFLNCVRPEVEVLLERFVFKPREQFDVVHMGLHRSHLKLLVFSDVVRDSLQIPSHRAEHSDQFEAHAFKERLAGRLVRPRPAFHRFHPTLLQAFNGSFNQMPAQTSPPELRNNA